MKPITVYQADDGSRWDRVEDAHMRDALIVKVDSIPRYLGMKPRPDLPGCRFENGEGFVQQPRGTRDKLWTELQMLGWSRDSDGPIGKLAHRAMCLDKNDREWGQPYFANNPGSAPMVEVG